LNPESIHVLFSPLNPCVRLLFSSGFENLTHVSACRCEHSARVSGAGAGLQHDERRRQIVARLTQSVFRSGQAYTGDLFENSGAAAA